MTTTEIPPAEWAERLNIFSRNQKGQRISIDVLSPELGAQTEVENLPLVGLIVEPNDGGTMIAIAAGGPDDHIDHTVPAPSKVWLERNELGGEAAMQIESADGTRTIVRLVTPSDK